MKDRQKDSLLWGDEVSTQTMNQSAHSEKQGSLSQNIEYMLVSLDRTTHRARLSQRGHELLGILQIDENEQLERAKQTGEKPELEALWRPEFGRYMIEGMFHFVIFLNPLNCA
ncbi:hypothetical protein GGI23_006945 [Coemansia sp. RSA 2559]|nr:hypothetical protein GGI23_006945 [Coemansia sp. RSA 2559]